MRRIVVLLVAVGALAVPAAAAAPTSGGTEQTLAPGEHVRWLSRRTFEPRQLLRITVWVDDVGIDLRGRLPLKLYHTVDGVGLTVRSVRYPSGPRQRLFLQAGNGRADPVTIKLRWRIPCRPAVEACEAPPPIAICDCPPEGDCACGGGEDLGDVRRVRPRG